VDPEVVEILAEIDEAERRLRPEFAERVRADSKLLKRAIKARARELNEIKEQLGEDRKDSSDDVIGAMDNDVEALVEENQTLTEETMALMTQVEALEKLKEPQSFLSHFRASARLLKPE
jgi:cell division protein ZapA (FtsZ GTPase activity inhibitor)